jgi:peptidoglycan/xylan/chitin deacetylase (PgdA/CDA1 family)
MALSITILTFHSLDEQLSVISFPPELFRRGMTKLYENGYRTMRLLDAVDCLRAGKAFPDQSFAITFDDGYESVYREAFPVLQDYAMSATIFLTVGEKGEGKPGERLPPFQGRSMLNWTEIEEMKRWGMEFGAHTLTHPDLTRIPRERMEREIRDSKIIIENTLGTPVSSFAYPYGQYNESIQEFIQQHFACACSDKLGLMNVDNDPYALERIETYYLRTKRLFDIILTPLFPWYIRARSIPRGIRRFVQNGLK